LIDRLIHSRGWIPVIGVLLVGIVAMQVEVLKLNASMGRAIEQGSALQSRNELLRERVASLGDDQRIESLATKMGMSMPAPDAPSFLSARAAGDVQHAIANIHAPDPAAFTAANAAVVTPVTATPATSTPVTTTPATVTPATSSSSTGG
jgi:cell division protein FtsL